MNLKLLLSASRLRLSAWIVFFGLMLLGGYHRYYIASWQLPIISGGALVLGLVFTIDLASQLLQRRATVQQEGGTRFTRLMETLAHSLPLFVFLSVGVSDLSGSPLTGGDSARAAQALARAEPTLAITGPIEGREGYQPVSLLQLFTAGEHSEKAAVEIEGRLYKTGGQEVGWLDPALGHQRVEALLYRYLISCCVADAMPLSVVLSGADTEEFEQQGWVRVRGTLASLDPDGTVLSIAVDSIEAIPAPGHPYLSLYDKLLGEGGAVDLHSGDDGKAKGAGMDATELVLDPANPAGDPLKNYAWPQSSDGSGDKDAPGQVGP